MLDGTYSHSRDFALLSTIDNRGISGLGSHIRGLLCPNAGWWRNVRVCVVCTRVRL